VAKKDKVKAKARAKKEKAKAAKVADVVKVVDSKPAFLTQGIGWAVKQLQDGKKVCRAGWNGKGMWIVLMPELNLPPYSTQEPGAKVNDRTAKHIGADTPLESQPYISMWTAQGKWQPGWLASQPDLLATDWEVVDAEKD